MARAGGEGALLPTPGNVELGNAAARRWLTTETGPLPACDFRWRGMVPERENLGIRVVGSKLGAITPPNVFAPRTGFFSRVCRSCSGRSYLSRPPGGVNKIGGELPPRHLTHAVRSEE